MFVCKHVVAPFVLTTHVHHNFFSQHHHTLTCSHDSCRTGCTFAHLFHPFHHHHHRCGYWNLPSGPQLRDYKCLRCGTKSNRDSDAARELFFRTLVAVNKGRGPGRRAFVPKPPPAPGEARPPDAKRPKQVDEASSSSSSSSSSLVAAWVAELMEAPHGEAKVEGDVGTALVVGLAPKKAGH